MFLNKIFKLFKKVYKVYEYSFEKKRKHVIHFSNDKKEATSYLERLLDSKLEDYCHDAKDENSFVTDYLNNRMHSYKIENTNFNEIDYIKNNALRIYKEYQSKQ